MSKIVSGSVVRLRSGGPNMSVLLTTGEEALCGWFESDTMIYGPQNNQRETRWGAWRKELIAIEALELVEK